MTTYTADQLIEIADGQGFDVSRRLVTDWVQKGLIDGPRRVGRGKGAGKGALPGTWSDRQLELFLLLLRKHQEGAEKLATLANIPVSLWLYWGDPYATIRQVKRALSTWAEAYQRGSWRAAMHTAREVVEQFDHGDAPEDAKEELVRVIAEGGYRGRIDRDQLAQAARCVFDPEGSGRGIGPARMLPESYAMLVDSRVRAIALLPNVPDDLLRFARDAHRDSLAMYLRDQPYLVQDPDVAKWAERPDLERLVNRACADLTAAIGVMLIAGDRLKASEVRHT